MMNMSQITAKKIELEARVTTPGYVTTERDVAEAQELINAYIDELERLEQTAVPYPDNLQDIPDAILKRWYPHE